MNKIPSFTLWDKLSNFVSWLKNLIFSRQLELTILGLQNAGKTSFLNLLTGGKFDTDTIPTIGFNFREVSKGLVQFKIFDLGGQPRFRESWEKYSRAADCIIYIVDSSDLSAVETSKYCLHNLLQSSSLEGIPLLLLSNKVDKENTCSEHELITLMSLSSIADRQVSVYSISCKSQVNISKVLKWLSEVRSRKNK